jgi:DNA polymerase
VSKQALLDQIKADILSSNVCPDLAKQATQLVFGDGTPDADLLFIGEAPGKQEDEQGLPFVGASGKFLAEMLSSIYLQRSQVYITNIVKYRPPQNRDPLPDEKRDFLPYLIRQIDVISPKLIITLGRHSGMAFLPDLVISRDHGKPKKISIILGSSKEQVVSGEVSQETALQLTTQPLQLKVTVLPLYHPAAALYNGGQRQTLMDDFALIPEILKKINSNT